MKQCSYCSKASVYHVTVLHDGDVKELHFCEQHFHEYMNKPDDVVAEGLASESMLPAQISEEELAAADELRCPNCGISYREFREQGRLGCPHDYIVFQDKLLVLLENIHNDTEHVGKYPKRAPLNGERQYELIQLRRQLTDAIKEENYEQAASLRDQINQIEEHLND